MLHRNIYPGCHCSQCLLATSAALFELRDALVTLSLSLKDLQFETDLKLRAEAEKKAELLLKKIALSQGSNSWGTEGWPPPP